MLFMKKNRLIPFLCALLVLFFSNCNNNKIGEKKGTKSAEYSELNNRLAIGWNTWNTNSVLSQVLLPECYSINFKLHDRATNEIIEEAFIGRKGEGAEKVKPGPHNYDGSYSELEIEWKNRKVKVQSVSEGKNIGILISPIGHFENIDLLVKPEILWGKPGEISFTESGASFNNGSESISFTVSGTKTNADSTIRCSLISPVCISTWSEKNVEDIESSVEQARSKYQENKAKYKSDSLSYEAMQSVLAWNVIYEPNNERVIVPVSRLWNVGWGGWVLFDWDTYFASYMLAFENKDLAYANVIAITKEISRNGFIPNFSSGNGKSEDRSQPPVGSLIVKEIYKEYQEKWFLLEVFDELLSWNRWWEKNRDIDGYLCWGSDVYDITLKNKDLGRYVVEKQAAMWESGLDNSPMYYEAAFDSITYKLMLADVGLMSLYIADCESLAEIAAVLNEKETKRELIRRGEKYKLKLETLWNDKFGLYLNKNLMTGEFSYRLSPTLFYPLIAKIPDSKQAKRMIDEHFYNPKEFWGEWIMPSISRNDEYFERQDYWRGRIWAPMNFLVYLGLRNYDLPGAQKDMVEKSTKLLLQSWTSENYVCENYNAIFGTWNDRKNCDTFYHWGALLGYISLIENGYVLPPETKLKK